jgi:hypothetical protein
MAKTMGAIETLTKPFDLRAFLKKVQELLE